MPAILLHLRPERANAADQHVAAMAELLGLAVRPTDSLSAALAEARTLDTHGVCVAIAVSGRALRMEATVDLNAGEGFKSGGFLVYDFGTGEGDWALIRATVGFAPKQIVIESSTRRQLRFHRSGVLSGQVYDYEATASVLVFEGAVEGQVGQPLVTVNGRGMLVERRVGHHRMLCLPSECGLSLDLPFSNEIGAIDYSELLPVAIALRALLGEACRHNPFPAGCVIIDDPLLTPRYGFFRYNEIIPALESGDFSLAVAFIPWNYRRSDPEIIQKVLNSGRRLSICIHGCDHTESEFGSIDENELLNLASCAMHRMEDHRRVTGLGFDRVMVFPQGVFSTGSMVALRRCGYLAAVNTAAQPIDAVQPVSLRAYFDLALEQYGSFPLFTRRYPRDQFAFAVDLFFGKPALIVEHHEFFRHGIWPLLQFVAGLQSLPGGVEWLTLEQVLVQSAQYQKSGLNEYEVRFVTSKFRLRNPISERCRFRCYKLQTEPFSGIFVNGRPHPVVSKQGLIQLVVELPALGEAIVELRCETQSLKPTRRAWPRRLSVWLRRALSEVRDNRLSGNEWLFKAVKKAKQLASRRR